MSDYRNFVRAAAGFNGTTVDGAVYSQVGFLFTTPTASAVGRFTPGSLLRASGACSVVQPMLKGTVNPATDTFSAATSTGQVRYSKTATIAPGTWMFLGPQDVLVVTSAAATGIDILVNDLTDEQLQSWILSDITQEASSSSASALPVIISAADPVTLTSEISGGLQFVETTGAAAQTLALPALASVAQGTEVVHWNSSGNAHEIAPNGTDEINGANAVFAVAAGKRVIVYSAGTAIGWLAILTA